MANMESIIDKYSLGSGADFSMPPPEIPSAAPIATGPAPVKKPPLAMLQDPINKIPWMQRIGDVMKDPLMQNAMFMGGRALQTKNPIQTLGQSLADVKSSQMLAGTKQAPAPVAPAPQAPPVQPRPNPLVADSGVGAPSVKTAPLPGASPQTNANFSEGGATNVGGTVPPVAPIPAAAPVAPVQARPTLAPTINPTLRTMISQALANTMDTEGPQHDPWGAGAITALRPGFNPHTGKTAGQEATAAVEAARIAESTRRDAHAKNLIDYHKNQFAPEVALADVRGKGAKAGKDTSAAYKSDLEAGLGTEGQRSAYISGIKEQEAGKAGGKKYGEIAGESAAVEQWIKDNPVMASTPITSGALKAVGITNRAELARSFKTINPAFLSSIESAAARVEAARISKSGYVEGEQLKVDTLQRSINNDRAQRAQAAINGITSKFFDPETVKAGSADYYAQLAAKKQPMDSKVKAAYDAAMADYADATAQLKGLTKPAAPSSTPVAPPPAKGNRRDRGKGGFPPGTPPAHTPPAADAKGTDKGEGDSKPQKNKEYKPSAEGGHVLAPNGDTVYIPPNTPFRVSAEGKIQFPKKKTGE